MKDWRRYDAVANEYERVRAPMTRTLAADLVALASPAPDARVLDVGTGTGVAAEAAGSVTNDGVVAGVDRSPPMLVVGKTARPSLRLAAAEAIQLPFRDGSFDVVIANLVLPEFKRYDTALFDLIRVLRTGGTFAASAWRADEDELSKTWRALVEETVGPDLVRSAVRDATPWAERFGDPIRFRDTLHEAGLRQINVERRSYRFVLTRDDYVIEQATRALGRFVRGMLGEASWASFLDRGRRVFAERFGSTIEDTREAILAVGINP